MIGCGQKKGKHLRKPEVGHFRAQGVPLKRKLREFRVTEDALLPVCISIGVRHFVPGQFVDIAGITRGKGFQRNMWIQRAAVLNSYQTCLFTNSYQVQKSSGVVMSMSTKSTAVPIMVNSCNGKMGSSVIIAADAAGLPILPKSFGPEHEAGKTVEICGNEIKIHGPSDRESVLACLYEEHPNMIVVDYTVPAAVNANADLYCKIGVPFVMGTTGGDRDRLYKTVKDTNNYAVISPQMGKQVVAFLAAMGIMAEQFPGAFSGYSLHVKESHQAGKLDTSGTAKAVISCFEKLGVSFNNQIEMIRDPKEQLEMVGVPEEYLTGHAFHMYFLSSPDKTVSFEFQHNVCGRSIYAEGTVDATLFLAKKIESKADKRIYDMIDVLREGNMR